MQRPSGKLQKRGTRYFIIFIVHFCQQANGEGVIGSLPSPPVVQDFTAPIIDLCFIEKYDFYCKLRLQTLA